MSICRKKWNVAFTDFSAKSTSAAARAAVLFDGDLVLRADEIRSFAPKRKPDLQTPRMFDLVPSRFLALAKSRQPFEPKPTASSFAQWVYSLYGSMKGTDEDRESGIAAEKDIWARRIEVVKSNNEEFLLENGSDWKLIHCGLNLEESYRANYFKIPDLSVNGKPLCASPDLIYQNSKTNEIIIVEVKYTWQIIPENLWPNIWSQLWCYSKIPYFQSIKKITVVGEVWSDTASTYKRNAVRSISANIKTEESPGLIINSGRKPINMAAFRGFTPKEREREIRLRASVRRNPRLPAYDRFFGRLFDIYRGHI